MNFLGIGPGEFFFILIVTLIVIGPERLPGFARSLGRNIVRLRNWMNASPDAQLILQLQHELESEINDIRSTLRQEMQSVRAEFDEVRHDLQTASTTVDHSLTQATTAATSAQSSNNSVASSSTANDTFAALANQAAPAGDVRSDVTAPFTIAATEPTIAPPSAPDTNTVARSRKPHLAPLAETTPPDDAIPADTLATDTPAADGSARTIAALQAEVATLRQELKAVQPASPSGVSHDSFVMMRIEVEQMSRELATMRGEISKNAARPSTPASVSYDDFMVMRITVSELTQRIDALTKQLAANTPVEPSA